MLQSPLNRNGNAMDDSRHSRVLQGGGIHGKMRSFVLCESKHDFTWRKNINMKGCCWRNRGTLSPILQDRKRWTGPEGTAWNCSRETAGLLQCLCSPKRWRTGRDWQMSSYSVCDPTTESTFFHQQTHHGTSSNSWQKDWQEDPKDIIILTGFMGQKGSNRPKKGSLE